MAFTTRLFLPASAHVSLGWVVPACPSILLPHHISFSEDICLISLSSNSPSDSRGRKEEERLCLCLPWALPWLPFCLVLVVNLLDQLESSEFCHMSDHRCPLLTKE